MREIRIANVPDGRTVEYDPQNLESGGIIIEAFYLGSHFRDTDLRLYVRDHKNIKFITFAVGSILTGERLIDEEELRYVVSICPTAQDQFFDQTLQVTLEN